MTEAPQATRLGWRETSDLVTRAREGPAEWNGVPDAADRDGFHWLRNARGQDVVLRWCPLKQPGQGVYGYWWYGLEQTDPVAKGMTYLGCCPPPEKRA